MIQGDKIRVTIADLNNEGEGVVRAGEERFVIFVPDALPGEEEMCIRDSRCSSLRHHPAQ